MPPDGYSVVTIRDEVAAKLARIMATHDLESLGAAIEYAADETLAHEDDLTVPELVQMLSDRVG